jgi:hypothetical protein
VCGRLARRWLDAGEVARPVLPVADAIDDAIALKGNFADRILEASLRHHAAAARQGGEALGELAPIQQGVLRDIIVRASF